jgi:hypothetical protein
MTGMTKKSVSKVRSTLSPIRTVQLKVTLKYIRPPIWRRLVLADNASLRDLHWVIQKAMGWDNDHMHAFYIDKIEYAGPETAEHCGVLCDEDFCLHQVIKRRGQRFTYEYDFGDCWRHEILVEKIVPSEGETHLPSCLDGARACPREDCGGVGGYEAMLEAKRNPSKERLAYWGEPEWVLQFDPERFDLQTANQRLHPAKIPG